MHSNALHESIGLMKIMHQIKYIDKRWRNSRCAIFLLFLFIFADFNDFRQVKALRLTNYFSGTLAGQ